MNQKILSKYYEKWFYIIKKDKKKKEIIENKEKILLKYVRNKDNYLFLFMK